MDYDEKTRELARHCCEDDGDHHAIEAAVRAVGRDENEEGNG